MFFDRFLKLQTLKFRLLGSTSFAQLYSTERLPLSKFRKEGAMLSPLIAGLLAACGGDDRLFGGPGNDVLYGDAGRDRLTVKGGANVFVAQKVSPDELAAVTGSKFIKFLDEVNDFIIGEDKIGIPSFDKITELAKNNDYDFDEARRLYFEDVEKRASELSKGEVDIVLADLGYYFRLLNPTPKFKRKDDNSQQF